MQVNELKDVGWEYKCLVEEVDEANQIKEEKMIKK